MTACHLIVMRTHDATEAEPQQSASCEAARPALQRAAGLLVGSAARVWLLGATAAYLVIELNGASLTISPMPDTTTETVWKLWCPDGFYWEVNALGRVTVDHEKVPAEPA